MNTKKYILLKLLLLILRFSSVVSESIICGYGCVECDKNLKCLKCEDGFNYDQASNNCVYLNCEKDFFYQQKTSQEDPKSNKGLCLAICDDAYYQSQSQNACMKFDQCSLSYESQKIFNKGIKVLDIVSYKYEYIIAIYQNQINQIERINGKINQILDISEDIIKTYSMNQQIFILQNDLKFYQWDISYNNKIYLSSFEYNIQDTKQINLSSINNQIVYCYFIDKSIRSLVIQQLFSIFQQNQSTQISQIKETYEINDTLFVIDNFILYHSEQGFRIDEIIINDKQNIEISKLTKLKYICSDFIHQNIKMIKKSKSRKYLTLIFTESKSMVLIQQDTCLKYTFNQIPAKFEPISYQDKDYLIFQIENQIAVYNVELKAVEFTQDISPHPIIDISVSNNNKGISWFIFCLLDNQIVSQYNLQIVNNSPKLNKIKDLEIIIKNPSQLFSLSEISSNNIGERLFIAGTDIQSQLIKNIDQVNDQHEKYQYIITNYELSYDTIPSPIVSSVLLEDQKTILACTRDGFIYSWDNGHLYRSLFQNKTQIKNSSCIELKLFNNVNKYDVLGIFTNQIIIFDSFNLEIKYQYSFKIIPQSVQPLISLYQNLAIIIFDENVYYIQQEDYTFYKLTLNKITTDIVKIQVQQNNQLLIQRQLSIESYNFNLSTKELTLKNQYNSNSPIQVWKTKEYPQSYSYQIEIYLYHQDNTFIFMKNDLVPFNKINSVPLELGTDITFLPTDFEDKVIFILGKTNKVGSIFPYECYALQSNKIDFTLFFSISNAQTLIEPIKYIDSALATVYDVKVNQNLTSMSTILSFSYNIGPKTSFYDEITILQGVTGSKYLQTINKNFTYVYDENGFLGLNIIKRQYYNMMFSVSDADISKGDQITDIQQSYLLDKFFVIKRNIQIFNYHTYILEEEITFELNSSDPVKTFLILESQKIIIACKKNIIKLKNYSTNQLLTYKDTTIITNIQIVSINNVQFLAVYGMMILRLNLQLVNEENLSLTFKDQLTSCFFSKNIYICKLSTNIIQIIDSSKLSVLTQLQPKSLSTSFLISIDESFDRLFLYTESVEIYSLQGVFQQKMTPSLTTIIDFKLYGNNIILVTSSKNLKFLIYSIYKIIKGQGKFMIYQKTWNLITKLK